VTPFYYAAQVRGFVRYQEVEVIDWVLGRRRRDGSGRHDKGGDDDQIVTNRRALACARTPNLRVKRGGTLVGTNARRRERRVLLYTISRRSRDGVSHGTLAEKTSHPRGRSIAWSACGLSSNRMVELGIWELSCPEPVGRPNCLQGATFI